MWRSASVRRDAPPKAHTKPFFVLMGDVGSGKSTLCEKLTGRTGLSSDSAESFTKESKIFLSVSRKLVGAVERRYWIADTPGLNSMKGRVDHALNVLGAMRFKPVTCLLMVCSLKDRLDGLAKALDDLVTPFIEEFGNNIAVIVTKSDLCQTLAVHEITGVALNLGLCNVMVTSKGTTNAELLAFLQKLEGITPIDVTIAPENLVSYFNLTPPNLRMRAVYNKYVAHYKNLAESGTQQMNTLQGDDKRDFAFSFKAMMYDLIPKFQAQLSEELGDSEASLLFCGEIKKEFKRKLLEIRNHCKEELYVNHNSQFRQCPYCGNIWVLVEGSKGKTVCGNRPLTAETWRPFNVFDFDIKKLLKLNLTGPNWAASTTTTRSCRFTDAQIENYLSDPKTPAETARAMRALRTIITKTSQDSVNQHISALDPTTKSALRNLCRQYASRHSQSRPSRLLNRFFPPTEEDMFETNELKLCFEFTIAPFFERTTGGSNPELTKPCGRTIAWKDMAPVPPPSDWASQSENRMTTVDIQDSPIDTSLHRHLKSKITAEVNVAVDPRVAAAFGALKTMRRWSQSDQCVIKVRDVISGQFCFPVPEGGPEIPLRILIETNPKFKDPRVELVVKHARGWSGLADDEIRVISGFTAKFFPTLTPDIMGYLLQSLTKCPAMPGKVYSVSNHRDTENRNTQCLKGRYIIWPDFTACSRSFPSMRLFNLSTPTTLYEIDQGSGVDIDPVSVRKFEDLTVLIPNTVFQVVDIAWGCEASYDTVHLREVPRGADLLGMMECTTCEAEVEGPCSETSQSPVAYMPTSAIKGNP
ncbi:hypothetical protein Pelo_10992 [Pelomyxa schiedti]|nr:hypothetical protein Pelo_10992 [Pelomyxa schiedti]